MSFRPARTSAPVLVALALVAVAVAVLALVAGAPATGQDASTTVPVVPTSLAPPIGDDDLEGDGGSPLVFVALSLLGGTTAVAIMAVQWIRTRPR